MTGYSKDAFSTLYKIDPKHAEEYRRDGHIRLEGVAHPQELTAVREHLQHQISLIRETPRDLPADIPQTSNLWRLSREIERFVFGKRFARIAAELMGVERVRVFRDVAFFKEPGMAISPWHADNNYLPLKPAKTITMWMALHDLPHEVGSMRFMTGSHLMSYRSRTVNDVMLARRKGLGETYYGALCAGDATFHDGWTLHCAPENTTPCTREVITVMYYADGAEITAMEGDQEFYSRFMEFYFPTLQQGDIARSSYHKLAYSIGDDC